MSKQSTIGLGIILAAFSGIFTLWGIGIVRGWELPVFSWWVQLLGFLAMFLFGAAALALYVFVMKGWPKWCGTLLLALSLFVVSAWEVSVLGISYEGATIVQGIPQWPYWVGVALIVCSGPMVLFGFNFLRKGFK